ncbi:hypothetical protein A4D02_18090 [Niastella koreensis]|uniref:DUF4468 domain-containing protein n=2 Tax=Niastella koreensis TaxID=354356 RepID=G8TAC9_NIAKG|nr:hypothetical protein [Niastella koreensis]AEV97076.1 hypothetical protein Niako_0693 [Niastella koreensis GR20-10]OQP39234.1 hypothetical protein A4D02_18090 [Niastella koreensis]
MKKHIAFLLFVTLFAGPGLQAQTGNVLLPPVKPVKADNKSPVIEIVIDPESFQELAPYKGMKFQIDINKTPLNPRDSFEEWNNLELIRAGAKGNYIAKFSNAKRTTTYAVKPVFEGEDYDKALQTFEREDAAYKQRVAEKARMAKADRAQYVKDSIQDRQIEKERVKKSMADWNSSLRVFQIDGFGVLNNDKAKALNLHYIIATFKTEAGEPINSYLAVYIRGVKGCISTHEDHFSVKPGADNMILGHYNGKFAYVSFEEFRKLNITADTKAQTFIMKVVSEKDNNIEYIKSLMK